MRVVTTTWSWIQTHWATNPTAAKTRVNPSRAFLSNPFAGSLDERPQEMEGKHPIPDGAWPWPGHEKEIRRIGPHPSPDLDGPLTRTRPPHDPGDGHDQQKQRQKSKDTPQLPDGQRPQVERPGAMVLGRRHAVEVGVALPCDNSSNARATSAYRLRLNNVRAPPTSSRVRPSE